MVKITKEAALHYHEMGKPGKIEIVPTNLIVLKLTFHWLIHLVWLNLVLKYKRIRTMLTATRTRVTW